MARQLLLSWLLLARPASSVPPEPSEKTATLVYRGDIRPPWAVRLDGGFHPTAPPDSEFENHYSLFNHVYNMDGIVLMSQYVSATRDAKIAAGFAELKLGGDFVQRSAANGDVGYVYHVQPTRNFIDVNKSLGRKNNAEWQEEKEIAALGGIRWTQVKGWSVLGKGPPTEALRTSRYEKNADYDAALDQAVASGAVPQLAGFPVGHLAWSQEPYKRFRNTAWKHSALQFMENIQGEVKWRGKFPLMLKASSILPLIEEMQKVVDKASRALQEAASAPGGNLELCATAEHKASKAAERAAECMSQIVDIYNDHPYLPSTNLIRAWAQVTRARYMATRARHETYINLGKSYREQVAKFRRFASEQNAVSADERRAAAIEAEESIELFAEMRQRFWLRLQKEQEIVRVQTLQIKDLLSSGRSPSDGLASDLLWIKSVEKVRRGLERKLQELEREDQALVAAERAMAREGAGARREARAAWEAVNEAMARELRNLPQAEPSSGLWEGLASELLIEALVTVPLLTLSVAGGPAGAVALGAHLYRSHRALNLFRWALHASKAVKIGGRVAAGNKKATAGGRKVGQLTSRLRSAVRSFRAKSTKETTPGTSPPSPLMAQSTSPRPQPKTLDEVLQEVANMEDPVVSPYGSSTESTGPNERTLEDLLQELESIKVPDHEPKISLVQPAPKPTKQRTPAQFKREEQSPPEVDDLDHGPVAEAGDGEAAACAKDKLFEQNLDAMTALVIPEGTAESLLDSIARELDSRRVGTCGDG